MGAIEHRWLLSISRVLSILSRSVTLAGNRSSGVGSVDRRSRDKGSLRAHGMKEALLVEADAVLTSSIGRAVIT